jgi:hypothetical protein
MALKEECQTCKDGFTKSNLLPLVLVHLFRHDDKAAQ